MSKVVISVVKQFDSIKDRQYILVEGEYDEVTLKELAMKTIQEFVTEYHKDSTFKEKVDNAFGYSLETILKATSRKAKIKCELITLPSQTIVY